MVQLGTNRPPANPLQCRICREAFKEEWMAQRCEAQGPPHIEYHSQDVVANTRGILVVCTRYFIHHRIGYKCNVEGPCPHDIEYFGYELIPTWFGPERAFIGSVGRKSLRPGWEKVTTLTQHWGVIPESGEPGFYLAVDPESEWEKLWKFYPPRPGRRGRPPGRRLEGL